MNRLLKLESRALLALILALLMVGPMPAIAQTPQPQPQTKPPSPFQNGGGVTASGRRWDYKKVEDGKVTYFHILRTREEIDEYLLRQGNADPEMKKLAQMPWTMMEHEWRRDPVTSAPIAKMPPTVQQQDELFEAIDKRLRLLSAPAKEEFKRKIIAGVCKVSQSLDPRLFVIMINGTGTNEKLEVPPELANRTRSCEFFLESESVVINLVFICGNFGYVFAEVWFETTPTGTGIPPVSVPNPATCELRQNGNLVTAGTPPFTLTPEQILEFRGRAAGATQNLKLKAEWRVKGEVQSINPDLDGHDDVFTFGPKITNFAPGNYPGTFDLSDQFGRQSSCPFSLVVKRVDAPPPPAPLKSACPTCVVQNKTFRVDKKGITLNVSDFVSKGAQLEPGSAKWTVDGNPAGNADSLNISTTSLNKKKEVQFKFEVRDVNGCVIVCEGRLKAAGGKWWIVVVVVAVAAAGVLVATHLGGSTAGKSPATNPNGSGDPDPRH
jgi:hypothetical protein